jgi:dihydrofolate reductase
LTLDGVMQAPGGPDEDRDGGFEHGGWGVTHFDEKMGQIMGDWMSQAGGFLLGRRTYQIFAAHWPRITDPQDPVASALNSLPKYVASRTLDTADWNNTSIIKSDVATEVARLKEGDGGEIQVHGSCDLIQTLLRHDLLDTMRLWVFPIALGTGKRLFGAGTIPSSFELTETQVSTTGVVLHVYDRAGKPEYGSFALDDAESAAYRGNEAWRR